MSQYFISMLIRLILCKKISNNLQIIILFDKNKAKSIHDKNTLQIYIANMPD